jgi:hypothetical protein
VPSFRRRTTAQRTNSARFTHTGRQINRTEGHRDGRWPSPFTCWTDYGSEGIRTLGPTLAGQPASNRSPSSTRPRFHPKVSFALDEASARRCVLSRLCAPKVFSQSLPSVQSRRHARDGHAQTRQPRQRRSVSDSDQLQRRLSDRAGHVWWSQSLLHAPVRWQTRGGGRARELAYRSALCARAAAVNDGRSFGRSRHRAGCRRRRHGRQCPSSAVPRASGPGAQSSRHRCPRLVVCRPCRAGRRSSRTQNQYLSAVGLTLRRSAVRFATRQRSSLDCECRSGRDASRLEADVRSRSLLGGRGQAGATSRQLVLPFDQQAAARRSPARRSNQGQVRNGWPRKGGRRLPEGGRPPGREVSTPHRPLAFRAGSCPSGGIRPTLDRKRGKGGNARSPAAAGAYLLER